MKDCRSLTALLRMENTFKSEDEPKQVYGENSVRRKFRTAKIPYGENSVRRKIRTAKIPTAKTPYGEKSKRWKHRTAKSPTAKIPTAKNLQLYTLLLYLVNLWLWTQLVAKKGANSSFCISNPRSKQDLVTEIYKWLINDSYTLLTLFYYVKRAENK